MLVGVNNQNLVYIFLIAGPPLLAIVVIWGMWRWAKRDEAQRRAEMPAPPAESDEASGNGSR